MVHLCLKILSELNMYLPLMMPMQKQATGKAAWGHATSGADPGFSERGVRKFKERGLECSPRSYRGLYC